MANVRMKRGFLYKVGTTGYTMEKRYDGYVVRCNDTVVATLMSRKTALAWVKRNANRCKAK